MKSIFFFCLLASSISMLISQPKENLSETIITSDVDLFWQCYDEAEGNITGATFKKYINEGSMGVKGFLKFRIVNAKKLAKTVKQDKAYYELVREGSLGIKEAFAEEIVTVYDQMIDWYPEAVIPDVYFVMGRKNSGGTAFDGGLIMGAEMFGPQGNENGPNAIIEYQVIPSIVAHELIHFQQKYPQSKTLLDQTIKEGAADFLAYLIQERELRHHLDNWAAPKVAELWKIFQEEMLDTSYQGWLYGGSQEVMPDAPRDLGYWLGFYICKAYYLKQEDPKQAVEDILTIQDSEAFLAASGFNGELP
ncbi:MAG: DUF2268 domain-containing putative Zn-dependent protease [Bacteroidota bacterium]